MFEFTTHEDRKNRLSTCNRGLRSKSHSLFLLLLESLGGGNFIAVVSNGCLGALLEGAKVEFLKLDRELVDLNFVLGGLGEANSELDRDNVSEWVSTRSSDRKVDVPNLGLISNHLRKDR